MLVNVSYRDVVFVVLILAGGWQREKIGIIVKYREKNICVKEFFQLKRIILVNRCFEVCLEYLYFCFIVALVFFLCNFLFWFFRVCSVIFYFFFCRILREVCVLVCCYVCWCIILNILLQRENKIFLMVCGFFFFDINKKRILSIY